jgi:hypothetical protein
MVKRERRASVTQRQLFPRDSAESRDRIVTYKTYTTPKRDSALRFSKPSLQLAISISFENLKRSSSLGPVGAT